MLARLSPLIEHGVIDNSIKELIDLRLWCVDEQEPLHLRMRGNCLGDIAGCRVEFKNHAAGPMHRDAAQVIRMLRELAARPGFMIAGDITCSERRPTEEKHPRLRNMISIEFFAGAKNRCLIELDDFYYTLSLPQWEVTREESAAQEFMNACAMRDHIDHVVRHFRGPSLLYCEPDFPLGEWDSDLNYAEACMAVYPSVHEKYHLRPGGFMTAAYVMNRVDFLGRLADRDERRLPPRHRDIAREWRVLDFLECSHAEAVSKAMHHPCFQQISSTADSVQRVIRGMRRPLRPEVDRYVGIFAGIVANTLATIVMTQQPDFSHETVLKRLAFLEKRADSLSALSDKLPLPTATSFIEAAASLHKDLHRFSDALRS